MHATKARQNSSRAATSKSKSVVVSPDDLADKLATKLTISNAKGKAKATEPTPIERKASAMRAINTASKSLSAILETGWKVSASKTSGSINVASVTKHATTALNELRILRTIYPGQLDTERAASSIAGKLIGLDMVSFVLSLSLPSPHSCPSMMPPSEYCKICTRPLLRFIAPPTPQQPLLPSIFSPCRSLILLLRTLFSNLSAASCSMSCSSLPTPPLICLHCPLHYSTLTRQHFLHGRPHSPDYPTNNTISSIPEHTRSLPVSHLVNQCLSPHILFGCSHYSVLRILVHRLSLPRPSGNKPSSLQPCSPAEMAWTLARMPRWCLTRSQGSSHARSEDQMRPSFYLVLHSPGSASIGVDLRSRCVFGSLISIVLAGSSVNDVKALLPCLLMTLLLLHPSFEWNLLAQWG